MSQNGFTLEELASLTQAKVVGNPCHFITGVADLEKARETDASFLANKSYSTVMQSSSAGVIFVDSKVSLPQGKNFLVSENPSVAFQQAAEALLCDKLPPLTGFVGRHSTAVVHETAQIGEGVTLGPHVVVDQRVVIGKGTWIHAGCYLGPGVRIGKECVLHPGVIIREGCSIGDRVILQPGVVIGSCGFGYVPDAEGHHVKMRQLSHVIIEDDVEIGANTTVDRGRINPTRIGRGTKIDNLVQIAHGVVLGEDNIIVAQTGIAGSTQTGRLVVMAGQVAVNGHITITDRVTLAARTGVVRSITEPGTYGGAPALPMQEYRRFMGHSLKITAYAEQLKQLQQEVAELKGKSSHDSPCQYRT